uniref:RING-type domain-containing protein n=1 Tax=Leersia perrieri TaxID=77586 RepID=A0A0D9XA10_9ORYZ
MEGRVLRRSVTLADQLAAVGPTTPAAAGSCNLRDLLKLRDEDDLASAGRRAAVTLASAMAAERLPPPPPPPPPLTSSSSVSVAAAAAVARTLLDIIRDDQLPTSSGDGSAGDPLVRRAVSLPAPVTASPPATEATTPPLPPPETQLPSPAAATESESEQGERVSLMALLEQTERQWSATVRRDESPELTSSAGIAESAPESAEETETEAAAGRGCCCVCMARAKGAAFIPCGHTFCRSCARELLAGRGRCPLCNAAILDVLDIF